MLRSRSFLLTLNYLYDDIWRKVCTLTCSFVFTPVHVKEELTHVGLFTEARDSASNSPANGQGNSEANSEANNSGVRDFNRDMAEAPQPSGTFANAGPQNPITPVRPRSLVNRRTKDSDHKVASPSSMSPFVPSYNNNSDDFAGMGSSQASSPSYTGYAGQLRHLKPVRRPLGPSGMSTAPTVPMAPMDEEELPSLPGFQTASTYGNDSPVVPGQYAEVNSSPPIQMPQPLRQQSAIERQAASFGMSVQELLNSSPAKQHPLPQAYQGSADDDYGFQGGYNYPQNYVQGLGQGYGNGYSQNYASNYDSPYGQGYNSGFQDYNQGYSSSPHGFNNAVQNYSQGFDSSPQAPNNGTQNYNQDFDSSPQGPSNGTQNYNQGFDSSTQGHNTGVQNYHQGYDSRPKLAQGRNQDDSYATMGLSSNTTRSAQESEVHSDEHHSLGSDNNYQNSGSPTEDYKQLSAYNRPGPQKSMTRV